MPRSFIVVSLLLSCATSYRLMPIENRTSPNQDAGTCPPKIGPHCGLVLWVCFREATVDWSQIYMRCTEDIPLTSAGKAGGQLASLREFFAPRIKSPEKGSTLLTNEAYKVSVAELVAESSKAKESGEVEVEWSQNLKKEGMNGTWQNEEAKFFDTFDRVSVIRQPKVDDQGGEFTPLVWKPHQRWLLCFGPSALEGESFEMPLTGCSGFWKDSEHEIGLLEQIDLVDELFSDPEELAKAAKELETALADIKEDELAKADWSALKHSALHVLQIYSVKTLVVIAGVLLKSAALTILGKILFITLPYSMYLLHRDGVGGFKNYISARKARNRIEKFHKLQEIADSFFPLSLEFFEGNRFGPLHPSRGIYYGAYDEEGSSMS